MGRVKSALIKRTARSLVKEKNVFSGEFNNNKNLLGNSMPSKRLRNRIAGYVTRILMNKEKKHKISETKSTESEE